MVSPLLLPAIRSLFRGLRVSSILLRLILCVTSCVLLPGCAMVSGAETRSMTVTAYCGCGECNSYSRGSWKYLKLDVWNRTVNAGSDKGRKYTGKTAAGEELHTPARVFFPPTPVAVPG